MKVANKRRVEQRSAQTSVGVGQRENHSSSEAEGRTQRVVPKDLQELLDYLEGYYSDDEGKFDATFLYPWRNLTVGRRNRNERILRVILRRMAAREDVLESHWRRLQADVSEYRRRQKAQRKLIRANAADIVLTAIVDALLPVNEVPAKELTINMRQTAEAASELLRCLTKLNNTGLRIEDIFPTEDNLVSVGVEKGTREYRTEYVDAKFYIYMSLPSTLTHEERKAISERALRSVVTDPSVTLGVLAELMGKARAYRIKRHNLSGRQRFAYVMATHMVRNSLKYFGTPRYERAESFVRAACGVRVKGLRQMMEREAKRPATKISKKRAIQLRGNRKDRLPQF